MKKLVKFIQTDINIQIALMVIVVGSCIFPILIMFTLPLLGAWQLYSAIYIWNKVRDSKRRNYLLYCMFHLSLMVGYAVSEYTIKRQIEEVFGGLFMAGLFLIIPPILAIWYLRYSYKTLNTLTESKHEFFTAKEMENILDSEEVLS